MTRSCTTTTYRSLFRDSPSSLRTLWLAVVKSPNFSARGRAFPVCLMHGALVILVRKHTSQFRSFGKWVLNIMLPWFWCHVRRTFRIWVLRTVSACRHFLCPLDCLWTPPTFQEDLARSRPNIGLLRDRTNFRVPFRHVALLLDLKMNLASPAVSM